MPSSWRRIQEKKGRWYWSYWLFQLLSDQKSWCYGDAGIIVINDEDLANKLRENEKLMVNPKNITTIS